MLFLTAFSFCFYAIGANAVEGYVNYPSWRHIPAASFPAFHRQIDRRVPVVVVLPTAIWTILTAILIFASPPDLPKWALIAALGLQLVGWATSFGVDIPIQISLSKDGWSADKVRTLIWTDRLLRQGPAWLAAGLYVWMMAQLLAQA